MPAHVTVSRALKTRRRDNHSLVMFKAEERR